MDGKYRGEAWFLLKLYIIVKISESGGGSVMSEYHESKESSVFEVNDSDENFSSM